jgi:copper(I)-binding protein
MNRINRSTGLAALSFAALAFAGFASWAHAEDFKVKDIVIVQPFAPPSIPGMTSGGAYLNLENQGKSADRLVSASSPRAKRVEIHTMSMDGGIMRMREIGGIDLPPGAKVSMLPRHGYHLMLMDLTAPLKEGETLPLTLTFEKAGSVEVKARVQPAPAAPGAMSGMGEPGHKMQ